MNEQEKNSGLHSWGKALLWVIAVILVLAAVVRLSLKTAYVQDRVKDFAVSTANEQLDGQLSIGTLSGDLWEEVQLTDIRIDREQTILHVDTVYTAYNILSLLGSRFEVTELNIISPVLRLRQEQGVWNVQELVKTSPDTVEQDTSGTTFPFQIDELTLKQGEIYVRSAEIPIESAFAARDLYLTSRLVIGEEDLDVDLHNLSFQIDQTRMTSPLKVQTSARADSNQVTLERFIVATGNSIISSSAFAQPEDSTLRFNLSAAPFSWRDAVQYTTEFPLRQDIDADLQISGSPELFNLSLVMEAEGLDSLHMGGEFRWKSGLILQEFTTQVSAFNPEILISDTTLPAIQHLAFSFTGDVPFNQVEQSEGELKMEAEGVISPSYQLDQITGKVNLDAQTVRADLQAYQNHQQIQAIIDVNELWADLPEVQAHIEGQEIDPGFWMQDTSYTGAINFTAELGGEGLFPDTTTWNYSLAMDESQVMNQVIEELSLHGKVSSEYASADGSVSLGEGKVDLNAEVRQLNATPEYTFSLATKNVDVGPFLNEQDITTGIDASYKGTGKGTDPSILTLNSSLSVDSSSINEEFIEHISANIGIQDSSVYIDQSEVKSSLVEGEFNGQFNLQDPYHPENEFTIDLQLMDISSLAPVFNTDTLEAEGTFEGRVYAAESEGLQAGGALNLSQVQYDIHRVEEVNAALELVIGEEMEYQVNLLFTAPEISGIPLQDLNIATEGIYQDTGTAEGQMNIEFSSAREGQIEYGANYHYSEDSTIVQTTDMNINSGQQSLNLVEPFRFSMQADSIQMDTMRVASGDTTYFEVAVPLITSMEQQGYLYAENIDMGVIQQALLGEPVAEGHFTGRLNFARRDTALEAVADISIEDPFFNGTSFDELLMSGHIKEERLQGALSIQENDTLLMDGALDLPFQLKDPETLPAEFFNQPVSGHLTVHDISLELFEEAFSEASIEETNGIISMKGTLDGTAGHPELSALASLREATLSGVPVDSFNVDMKYSHTDSLAEVNSSIISMQQKAANIQSVFPLSVDMRRFEINLPEEDDSVSVEVQMDEFNLSAINDFMDPETATDLRGQVSGNILIDGLVQDLQSKGQLRVRDGAFQVVPAGIEVANIASNIDFASDEIRVSQFRAGSGGGSLNAQGRIELDELIPGEMEIQVEANNFQAANTDEYNAIINLDARAEGNVMQPELKGSLEIVSGFIELDNFGEKSVETIELDTTQQEESSFSAYDSLRMEMEVSFDERFFIRNERYLEMEIELGGQVDLVKERGEELQLFGSLTTEDGYALPLGKQFDLEEGVVTFSGDMTNPELNIRTQYEPPQPEENIIIWYIIQGSVEEPQFVYESQPEMELENILSYTLFGQPFYALDSWEQLVTNTGGGNTTASDVAFDVLLDRVETVATQQLGIDVVRIENIRLGSETATSITTGWYLNPRVFFAIQNIITGSTPETGFLLEYMLRENLELMIRQGNGIREGIDILWEYDY